MKTKLLYRKMKDSKDKTFFMQNDGENSRS